MSKKPIVVFDLDGTLVDSAPDLLDSLNYCLDAEGLGAVAPADLHQLIGQGGRIMIERALTSQNVTPEPQHVDRLIDVFLQHYSENIPGKTRYFNGVAAALDALQQAGYLLAVCTNKYERLAKPLLNALDRPDRYATICGGDTFAWRKPDPRHILSTVEKAGGNAAQAVMVGDSDADINAAKAANIPVIAADFGYTDIPVEQLGANKIIASYTELTPELVNGLSIKKR